MTSFGKESLPAEFHELLRGNIPDFGRIAVPRPAKFRLSLRTNQPLLLTFGGKQPPAVAKLAELAALDFDGLLPASRA